MTEQTIENVNDSNVGNVSSSVSNVQQSSTQPADDYVPKSRVNDLIHERTKAASEKAYERGKAEALAQQQNNMGFGGMPMNEEKFRSMMAEEFRKQAQEYSRQHEQKLHEQQMKQAADNFVAKLQQSNPDLLKRGDDLMGLSELVPYINETGEVGKVTQHLLDNEGALASLFVLHGKSPNMVRNALKKIETRIKENVEAQNREYPQEPLSQPNPSVTTMDNDSSGSIEALKRQSWLRG